MNVVVGNIIESYYDELNLYSDLFTVESDFATAYIKNEASEFDYDNVSIIIDFVKPINRCHKESKSGFARFY